MRSPVIQYSPTSTFVSQRVNPAQRHFALSICTLQNLKMQQTGIAPVGVENSFSCAWNGHGFQIFECLLNSKCICYLQIHIFPYFCFF